MMYSRGIWIPAFQRNSDMIINAAVWRLDIFSFLRISQLNWIGHVNRMNSKRKVSQMFKNNLQGSR